LTPKNNINIQRKCENGIILSAGLKPAKEKKTAMDFRDEDFIIDNQGSKFPKNTSIFLNDGTLKINPCDCSEILIVDDDKLIVKIL
jgi:hypothetical protein